MDNSSGVGVLDKAALVLAALEPGPATLAGLVTATGLSRPTAHRLAVALEHHRLVARDIQGRFVLGPRLGELANAAPDGYTILFGKAWRAEMGIAEEEVGSPQPLMFIGSFICGLVIAVTLGLLIGDQGVRCGLKIGAGTGFGIGAAIMAQNAIYESKSVLFWAINSAYVVIGLAAMGAILGALQAP